MLNSSVLRHRALLNKSAQGFAGLGNKRKPTRKDLDKYDLIIVGANLGGIFSRHFDHVTHGHYSTMVCLDSSVNQQYVMRNVYEQGRVPKTEYAPFAKMAINMFNAHSEGVGVEKFFPEKNEIQLKNGRKIGYNYLVLAMGQKENTESIQGFEEAWVDLEHPFFPAKDHLSWKTTANKPYRWHYNYKGGEAIFHIPPYPFNGEIECYNFFLSKQIWNWFHQDGRINWANSKFTVVNANDKFVRYFEKGDNFIKAELEKRGIPVEYGQKLVKVDKNTQIATFEDVRSGARSERKYSQMYTLIPTKPHEGLVEAGLATQETEGFLDVNPKTLQHNKYPNIFGIGDVNYLPTTKSFYGGFQQIHVVRNNLERYIKGLPLNAHYDGFSEAPLILGQDQITWIQHEYGQKEGWLNLLGANNSLIAKVLYHRFSKMTKKSFIGLYLFKSWGPPYGKFKKTFKELPGAEVAKTNTSHIEPEKKTAH